MNICRQFVTNYVLDVPVTMLDNKVANFKLSFTIYGVFDMCLFSLQSL